ncbi:MAG: 6-phosphogluconolactonase [Thermoanaerobaculia bacterium]
MEEKLSESAPEAFEVRVLPDSESLAEEAARKFAVAATESVRERGLFRVALSGGSTPRLFHRRLAGASVAPSIAWERVRFFFGDERCVPPDHEQSNYRAARETLFDPLAIPAANVFRMRGEEEPHQAAAEYETQLRAQVPSETDLPRLDLVLLGLGPDGHTLSLFPGTTALAEKRRLAVANFVAELQQWRLTLTHPCVNAARRILFLVAGAEKSDVAAKILGKRAGSRALPAAGVKPRSGSVLWLLDRAAASKM